MSAHGFLEIEFREGTPEKLGNTPFLMPMRNSELLCAPVVNAKLLTKGNDVKRVFQLTICTKNINYEFEPGDTIGILPQNDKKEVEELITTLHLQEVADLSYTLSSKCTKNKNVVPKHLPLTGSVRELLIKFVDLRSPPKKIFLKFLAEFSSEEDKQKLDHICSPNGSKDYISFISGPGKTLLGILKTFPSCKCPLSRLLEHLPPMKPRPYSISSSPLLSDELSITFSVVHHDDGAKGLCSHYLEEIARNCASQPLLTFYFRKPTAFRFPSDNSKPLIMIGPGTGVAPFVAFLQQRYLVQRNTGAVFGKTWLFFGCRYSDRDYLYKESLASFLECGILSELFTSFSRENKTKIYVQHNVEKHGKRFVELLNQNALVYVCGDVRNISKNVKDAVVSVLIKHGSRSRKEAEDFVTQLKNEGRYVEDAWL